MRVHIGLLNDTDLPTYWTIVIHALNQCNHDRKSGKMKYRTCLFRINRDLAANYIRTLPAGTFNGYTTLTVLYDEHRIILLKEPFRNYNLKFSIVFLTIITSSQLFNNGMTSIANGVFSGLTALTSLY